MSDLEYLIEQMSHVTHGFTEIRQTSIDIMARHTPEEAQELAMQLFASEVVQARMLATFLFGKIAVHDPTWLAFLRFTVSRDADWRVQEILAQAFDEICKARGYKTALPLIEEWLSDSYPNVCRAVTEGLRIWTSRPYFREHPETAIQLLSQLHAHESEYLRRSVGNALRDISRKHPDKVKDEIQQWNLQDKSVVLTYKLASKFISS